MACLIDTIGRARSASKPNWESLWIIILIIITLIEKNPCYIAFDITSKKDIRLFLVVARNTVCHNKKGLEFWLVGQFKDHAVHSTVGLDQLFKTLIEKPFKHQWQGWKHWKRSVISNIKFATALENKSYMRFWLYFLKLALDTGTTEHGYKAADQEWFTSFEETRWRLVSKIWGQHILWFLKTSFSKQWHHLSMWSYPKFLALLTPVLPQWKTVETNCWKFLQEPTNTTKTGKNLKSMKRRPKFCKTICFIVLVNNND